MQGAGVAGVFDGRAALEVLAAKGSDLRRNVGGLDHERELVTHEQPGDAHRDICRRRRVEDEGYA
jgi:hypothetical protein